MAAAHRVLIVVTNNSKLGATDRQTGWYLPEVAHPWEVFTKNGFQVDYASPLGGKAPVDQGSVNDWSKDEISKRFLEDAGEQKKLETTLRPDQINPTDYKVIFYAGGHGPMWDMPDCVPMANLAAQIYEKNNGIVAAVCHGPVGLVNIKLSNGEYLLKSKKVTSFSNDEENAVNTSQFMPFSLEDKLKERGGIYSNADKWQAYIQVDNRVATGQNPASSTPLAEAIVKLL